MPTVRSDHTTREYIVNKALQEHGELNYEQLSKVTRLSYFTVRRAIIQLVEDGTVFNSTTQGKTLYFMTKDTAAMPSFLRNNEFIKLDVIMKAMAERPILQFETTYKTIEQVMALSYVQPIYATNSNAIDESEMKRAEFALDQQINRLEAFTKFLYDVKSRMLNRDVSIYQQWYKDTDYDPEFAIMFFDKVFGQHPAALDETPVGDSD